MRTCGARPHQALEVFTAMFTEIAARSTRTPMADLPRRLIDIGNDRRSGYRHRCRPPGCCADAEPLMADCNRAREGLINGDRAMAAAALSRLVSLAGDSWGQASEQGRAMLAESIVAGGVHASRLRRGEPLEVAVFDAWVAGLHGALAWHHYELASQAAMGRKLMSVANGVAAAIYHLRSVYIWADGWPSGAAAEAVAAAWIMGRNISRGVPPAGGVVLTVLAALCTAIHEASANVTGRADPHRLRRRCGPPNSYWCSWP